MHERSGVPVELRVATIFCAMTALLPIPLIMRRPLQVAITLIAFSKSLLIKDESPEMESASISMVRKAICLMGSFIWRRQN